MAVLSVPPLHGQVIKSEPGKIPGMPNLTEEELVYIPQQNFYGLDKLQFKVNYNDQVINVKYNVYVQHINSNMPCEFERDGLPVAPEDITQFNSN